MMDAKMDVEKTTDLFKSGYRDEALFICAMVQALSAERQAAALERIADVLTAYAAGEHILAIDIGS